MKEHTRLHFIKQQLEARKPCSKINIIEDNDDHVIYEEEYDTAHEDSFIILIR